MDVILYKIKTSEFFFFKIEKSRKKFSFLDFFTTSPFRAPERFLRMSPGFIMSGGVQDIRSTYVSNSTIKGERKCFLA